MAVPWSERQRRRLLEEAFALMEPALEDVEAANRLVELRRRYEEGLPRIALSRCPWTGLLVRHSFDPFGLDGLWWDYHNPARPLRERVWFCRAITGAVAIEPPVERFPFLAKPGPAAPYVIPRLLGAPQVQATLSSISCGRHRAWCVAYYSLHETPGLDWPSDWGSALRWDEGGEGPGGWCDAAEFEEEWDFELAPWIRSGKLAWIAPGDASMTLRRDLEGCPYLDLPGVRQMQYVQDGEVLTSSEILARAAGEPR